MRSTHVPTCYSHLHRVERGNGRGAKRHAIVVGPAVMERTTDGQYDWRDAGFKRPRHR